MNESGLVALLGPSLKHSLGSLLSLALLPALHGLDHGDLFGLLFLVPRLKQQSGVIRRRGHRRCHEGDQLLRAFVLVEFLYFFFYLFLMILCTMASVVRLFPLSTVRRIPLLLGSCALIKQVRMKMTQVTVMHQCVGGGGDGGGGFLQHMGQICPCQGIFLSSHDTQDPPGDKKTKTTTLVVDWFY